MERENDQPQRPRRAGVIGWPIGHSLSPLIHGTWAAREGIDASYAPIPAEPTFDAFSAVIDGLRSAGFGGVNVTIPHKENALRYADDVTSDAKNIGAANMLTFGSDRVIADNSDGAGFAAALGQAPFIDPAAGALVLGAGGAARAVLYALTHIHGVQNVTITNRTAPRAEQAAQGFNTTVLDWDERHNAMGSFGIIVNATSLGMTGQPALELNGEFQPGAVICDIVYTPLQTPLLKAAQQSGHHTVDGLSMLMAQAIPGYKAWLGDAAVIDTDLRDRLVSALNQKAAQ